MYDLLQPVAEIAFEFKSSLETWFLQFSADLPARNRKLTFSMQARQNSSLLNIDQLSARGHKTVLKITVTVHTWQKE
jgi:hypothetical protein